MVDRQEVTEGQKRYYERKLEKFEGDSNATVE